MRIHPSGPSVVAVCSFLDVPVADALAGDPGLVTIAADVRDPGNAGTLVRTSDALGVDAVVLAGSSVDLYNQKDSPGADRESNWPPAPDGKFILMLHMYWPNESNPSIIDGTWTIPPVRKVADRA